MEKVIDTEERSTTNRGRKSGIALVGGLLASSLLLSACAGKYGRDRGNAEAKVRSEQQQVLVERGITGNHELFDARTATNHVAEGKLKGSLGGLLLFPLGGASGSIDGEFRSKDIQTVILAWQTNSQPRRVIPSEVALNKIQYAILDKPTDKPSVQFLFDLNKMSEVSVDACDSFAGCHVDKNILNSVNPNDFLKDEDLESVVISLPKAQFDQLQATTSIVGN